MIDENILKSNIFMFFHEAKTKKKKKKKNKRDKKGTKIKQRQEGRKTKTSERERERERQKKRRSKKTFLTGISGFGFLSRNGRFVTHNCFSKIGVLKPLIL